MRKFENPQWYRVLGPPRKGCGTKRIYTVLTIALVMGPLFSEPTRAQQGFDPRQTEQRFDTPQASGRRAPQPVVRRSQLTQTPMLDSNPSFVLRSVSVHGATVLPASEIEQAYQPFLGRSVSPADLGSIATKIGEMYRTAGYHLSRVIVPPQDVQAGRVRITVIEGKITELEIKGQEIDRFGVRPILAAVVLENPSRLSTMERKLLLVNDIPGIKVIDTALEEIGNDTGCFRLSVTVKSWRIYSSLGLDSLGSASVGPWQAYATAAFNSYITAGDALAVNYSTVANDPRELGFGRLTYDTPVGIDGARVGVTALHSEVRPGDFRRNYNDTTTTDSLELRGSITPVQSRLSTLTLTVTAGVSNVSEKDMLGPFYNDRIRTVGLASDYRLVDNFGGTNYFFATIRQGLNILGASRRDETFLSRDGASGEFSVLNTSFIRYQKIAESWSLKISAAAQFASAPLLTSQQFYLGGLSFGRGYGSAEISGDNAFAQSVEIRFDQSLNFKYLNGFQLYSFVDNGAAWNYGYRYGDGLSLTSAGAGIRFFFSDDLNAGLAVAIPLTYRAPDNEGRAPRFLFSISNAVKI